MLRYNAALLPGASSCAEAKYAFLDQTDFCNFCTFCKTVDSTAEQNLQPEDSAPSENQREVAVHCMYFNS